jgi:TolB-like protein
MKLSIFILLVMLLSYTINAATLDTLAVTPFQVLGDSADSDIYSYGLPDAIANDLAQAPGITVIERLRLSAILQELKLSQSGLISEQSAPEIGAILGAKTIITGTIQKDRQEVRANIRAIEVATGKIIFSIKADQKINQFSDVFKLEDLLAQQIIFRLGLKLSEQNLKEIEKNATQSEEAFKCYSTGFRYLDSGDYFKGVKYFDQAVAKDKNFSWAQQIRLRAQQAFEELEKEINKK